MDLIFCLIIGFLVLDFIISFYLYGLIATQNQFVSEISSLVSRTFREYYKGEDIEPVVINNGIDLVWKGGVEGSFNEDNKQGFITIMTNDGNINSPIRDLKEADIIGGKIIHMVYEYIKENHGE